MHIHLSVNIVRTHRTYVWPNRVNETVRTAEKKPETRILYGTMRWQRLSAFRFSNLINRGNYCCFVCCDACTYARERKFIDVQIISVALIINLSFQTSDVFFARVCVSCRQTISKSYTFDRKKFARFDLVMAFLGRAHFLVDHIRGNQPSCGFSCMECSSLIWYRPMLS